MNVWLYLFYCILIILILIFSSLAIIYKQHLKDCSEPSNPWCYNDWMCNVSVNIDTSTGGLLDSMKSAHIVPEDAAPGSAYNVKVGIIDQYQNQCSTDSIYDENGNVDDNKIKLVNPITGETCTTIGENCKILPKGCTQNLYGEDITTNMIWGISDNFS